MYFQCRRRKGKYGTDLYLNLQRPLGERAQAVDVIINDGVTTTIRSGQIHMVRTPGLMTIGSVLLFGGERMVMVGKLKSTAVCQRAAVGVNVEFIDLGGVNAQSWYVRGCRRINVKFDRFLTEQN